MQINEKVFKTLEYDKIRAMLASLATTEGARAQALTLVPDVDEDTVRYRLRRTGDGVRLLFDKGMPSFGGVKDPADALERAGLSGKRAILAIERGTCSKVIGQRRANLLRLERETSTRIERVVEREDLRGVVALPYHIDKKQ